MTKTQTKTQTNDQLELIDAETVDDLPEIAAHEHALSVSVDPVLAADGGRSLVERLQGMEDAAIVFQRRIDLLETCRNAAIRATNPEDWILNRDRSGKELAMLKASGANVVAMFYGITVENVRPRGKHGEFEPDVTIGSDGRTLRAWCDAYSNVTGRSIRNLEASRSSTEKFIGRGPDAGELVAGSDLRSAVYTLLLTKSVRVLAGMSQIPKAVLDDAWKGTGKTTERCVKGSGYGTAKDRAARDVSENCTESRKELGDEILRRTGGDIDAARSVLVDITKNDEKGFAGFDSIDRLTKSWQVEQARKRLATHPVFGDDMEGGPDDE